MASIKSFSTCMVLGLSMLLLPAAASAQKTLTLGGSDSIGSLLDRQNVLFTKLVNERAAGKLKINFIQGEQLGNDQAGHRADDAAARCRSTAMCSTGTPTG